MSLLYILRKRSGGGTAGGGTTPPPAPSTMITDPMQARGDSITQGVGTSAYQYCWVSRLSVSKGVTITNYGQNGAGVEYMTKQMNRNLAAGNAKTQILAHGLNDLQKSGADAKNTLKIQDSYRHAIATAMMQSFTPANDAAISITGTYSTFQGFGDDPKSSYANGLCVSASGQNTTIGYSFSGDHIGFLFFHLNSLTGQQVEVRIDGVLMTLLNTDHQAGGDSWTNSGLTMPGARVFFGLGSGNHTIEIKLVGTSGVFWFDGFFTLQPTASAPAVVLLSPCHMEQARYDELAAGSPSVTLSDAIIDQYGRDVIWAIGDEFSAQGYRVLKVDANTYYTPNATNTNADHIHPNDTGSGLVWQIIDEGLT